MNRKNAIKGILASALKVPVARDAILTIQMPHSHSRETSKDYLGE